MCHHLVCWARREAGEAIAVPEVKGPVFRPNKPQRLH
jgi:hypothetical protein